MSVIEYIVIRTLGRVQAFPMYGGLGMSAPFLLRESTDSLIYRLSDTGNVLILW